MKEKTAVIAHNEVQSELYNLLKEKGHSCEMISCSPDSLSKEYISTFSKIILPFPMNSKNIYEIFGGVFPYEIFSENQILISGMFDDELKAELKKRKINYTDYFNEEAYVLKNAFITSQGAMRLLYESTRDFLPGKTALVTGYGRIGESLSMMLKSAGLKVYVTVRSKEKAVRASAYGLDVLNMSNVKGALFYFDFIFNTVAAEVFNQNDVRHLKHNTLYFELASPPFGVDKEHFKLYGKNYIPAPALPGKFYPKAVAENIYSFITVTNLIF